MTDHSNADDDSLSDGGEKHGRWTKEEHQAFVEALRTYGKEWKKVQAAVKTRSSAQIRSHAQKYFQKMSRQEPAKSIGATDDVYLVLEMCENILKNLKRRRDDIVLHCPPDKLDESIFYLSKMARTIENNFINHTTDESDEESSFGNRDTSFGNRDTSTSINVVPGKYMQDELDAMEALCSAKYDKAVQ